MKNIKLKISLSIFSMLLCFSLFAQGPPGGRQGGGRGGQGNDQQRGKPDASQILSKLDSNNDDAIDKKEASKDKRGKISEDFEKIDTNSDELIDLEELEASLSNKKPKKVSAEAFLKEVDDNNDGQLNRLEVAAKDKLDLFKHFNEVDINKDDTLSLMELKAFFDKNKKSKPKKRR